MRRTRTSRRTAVSRRAATETFFVQLGHQCYDTGKWGGQTSRARACRPVGHAPRDDLTLLPAQGCDSGPILSFDHHPEQVLPSGSCTPHDTWPTLRGPMAWSINSDRFGFQQAPWAFGGCFG
ncbi:hypothetical protein [Streptomyces curacoi]|uniref:Uncharacterized protein n=1 Tax=Streptomyces curacoi TaxID=146536 RepID=A0A117NUN0_9ACTN|nr:hypothetical protein AQI70_35490 [Streptomyces curacoi]